MTVLRGKRVSAQEARSLTFYNAGVHASKLEACSSRLLFISSESNKPLPATMQSLQRDTVKSI
jgi:hypothetical protein